MARPSVFMISAGTVGVLVALFLLWHSMRADSAAPTPPTMTTTPRTPATAPTKPTRSAVAPRAPTMPAVVAPPSEPAPRPRAPGTPSVITEPAGGEQHLEFGSKQLHDQANAVEPLVRACVDQAVATGVRPTGTAMLTYYVAKRGDKLVVEDTGLDNEKTTLENPALLECLHQTAKAMKFEGLPHNAREIYAARRITLDHGNITEYRHATFSYLR